MVELQADRLARGAVRYSLKNSAEFKEEDHPRAADGKFGSGGSSKEKDKESTDESKKTDKSDNKIAKETMGGKLPKSFSERGPNIYFHSGDAKGVKGKIDDYGMAYLDDGTLGYAPEIGDNSGNEEKVWRMKIKDDAITFKVDFDSVKKITEKAFEAYDKNQLDDEQINTIETLLDNTDGDKEKAIERFSESMSPNEIGNESAWDIPENAHLIAELMGYPDVVEFEHGALLWSKDAIETEQNEKQYQEAKSEKNNSSPITVYRHA